MTQPLALVAYENLMPGSQLLNRLQDLGYRTQQVAEAAQLVELAEREKPMLIVTDLAFAQTDICALINRLKQNPATEHIPVLAFAAASNETLLDAGRAAGAKIVASEEAIQHHLPQLLEQALAVE